MIDNNTSKLTHEKAYRARFGERVHFYETLLNSAGENGYEALVRVSMLKNHHSIVDLGCGTGSILRYFKTDFPASQYSGIDISESAIEGARQYFPDFPESFSVKNIAETAKPAATFDLALSHMVLALVPEIRKTLSEINRILKPQGRLCIFTPAYWRLSETIEAQKFKDSMQMLNNLSPDPDSVGIGNEEFRSRVEIEKLIAETFPANTVVTFEDSDFIIESSPIEALQIFSIGMYQFMLIPEKDKGNALKTMFEFLQSIADSDGMVRMKRPMQLIVIEKKQI